MRVVATHPTFGERIFEVDKDICVFKLCAVILESKKYFDKLSQIFYIKRLLRSADRKEGD